MNSLFTVVVVMVAVPFEQLGGHVLPQPDIIPATRLQTVPAEYTACTSSGRPAMLGSRPSAR